MTKAPSVLPENWWSPDTKPFVARLSWLDGKSAAFGYGASREEALADCPNLDLGPVETSVFVRTGEIALDRRGEKWSVYAKEGA